MLLQASSITVSCNNMFGFLADLEFSRLESWSRDPFLQVLVSVLVLEPQSLGLGLGLGLGTPESRSQSWDLRP